MERARPPSWYAKVQIGLHCLSMALVIATIGAASYVAAQGYGHIGYVAMIMVAVRVECAHGVAALTTRTNTWLQVIYALALDIWEIVTLANLDRYYHKRLPVVHLAIAELVAALACFLFTEWGRVVAHITLPCDMDAPIVDCVGYVDLLRRVNRGFFFAFYLDWAVA